MTLAAVREGFDIEQIHPVFNSTYGIQTAETTLSELAAQETDLRDKRVSILREGDTEAAGTRSKLEQIEAAIHRLEVQQTREGDKIKSLTDELPELRKEAEKQLDKLVALEERLPEVSLAIESVNAQLASLLNSDLVEQLIDLVEKRNEVAKEYRGIPFLIRDVRSFFHLQPGVREVEAPKLPEHITDLVKALSK